jgi:putative endonuclease
MYYVYILLSKKDGKFYIGYTDNLKLRFKEHNEGRVRSTKARRPFELIYYEAFLNKYDAYIREKWLKGGWGFNQIRKILKNYLTSIK